MKKNRLNDILVSCILAFILNLLFTVSYVFSEDYYISYFDIITKHEGTNTKVELYFRICIANGYGLSPAKNIVESCSLTLPDGQSIAFTPSVFETGGRTEFAFSDNNQNTIFELSEYTVRSSSWMDHYHAFSDINPHLGGTYTLIVFCDNGQTISKTLNNVPAGLSIQELPPVTDLTLDMNSSNGEILMSWINHSTVNDSNIQLRFYLYKDGYPQNLLYRFNNLPPNTTSVTIPSRFSDWLKNTDTGINQFQLQIRTYGPNGSFSVTKQYYSFKSDPYAINQINNIKPSKKTIIIPLL
jgi:hypothetical protein